MVSLKKALGNAPAARALSFLIENEGDHSLTDISKGASIGWTTIHQFWKDLEELKLIIHTRQVGRAKMYALNENSVAIHHLKKFYAELQAVEAARELEEKDTQSKLTQ